MGAPIHPRGLCIFSQPSQQMSRLSIIALVFAIAAPCVLSYSSGYSSGSAAAGSSYASASGAAGGNVASASGSATAAKKITTIKQTVTFTLAGGAAAYTGDVKEVYEKGYGKAIGIYDTTKKAYEKGCSVASSASRRTDIKVAFVASIDQSQAGFTLTSTAQVAATGLDSAALKTAITATNTALGKSVAAPTVKTVAKPSVTNAPIDPALAAIAAGLAGWAIAVIIIAVFCCCCCPLIIFCACFGGMVCCIGAAASSEQ